MQTSTTLLTISPSPDIINDDSLEVFPELSCATKPYSGAPTIVVLPGQLLRDVEADLLPLRDHAALQSSHRAAFERFRNSMTFAALDRERFQVGYEIECGTCTQNGSNGSGRGAQATISALQGAQEVAGSTFELNPPPFLASDNLISQIAAGLANQLNAAQQVVESNNELIVLTGNPGYYAPGESGPAVLAPNKPRFHELYKTLVGLGYHIPKEYWAQAFSQTGDRAEIMIDPTSLSIETPKQYHIFAAGMEERPFSFSSLRSHAEDKRGNLSGDAVFPWLANSMIRALQVHIPVSTAADYVAIGNVIDSLTPAFVALAGNSPWICGRDSGLSAARLVLMKASLHPLRTGDMPSRWLGHPLDELQAFVENSGFYSTVLSRDGSKAAAISGLQSQDFIDLVRYVGDNWPDRRMTFSSIDEASGSYTLRHEVRSLCMQSTYSDTVAMTLLVLFSSYGAREMLVEQGVDLNDPEALEARLPFTSLTQGKLNTTTFGMDGLFPWFDGQQYAAQSFFNEWLVPAYFRGVEIFGASSQEAGYWLSVIHERVNYDSHRGLNSADLQRKIAYSDSQGQNLNLALAKAFSYDLQLPAHASAETRGLLGWFNFGLNS